MRDDRRYPLTWPYGWPRTPRPRVAPFDRARTLAVALTTLQDELRRLGAQQVVISTNVRLSSTGLPRSGERQPQDRGAAVYFQLEGKAQALACDRWDRVEDNLYAMAKHIEALRGQARWGVGTVAQAFAGYQQLPEPWWVVLGVAKQASLDEIETAFRRLAPGAHPDRGGSTDQMARLIRAREEGRRAWS